MMQTGRRRKGKAFPIGCTTFSNYFFSVFTDSSGIYILLASAFATLSWISNLKWFLKQNIQAAVIQYNSRNSHRSGTHSSTVAPASRPIRTDSSSTLASGCPLSGTVRSAFARPCFVLLCILPVTPGIGLPFVDGFLLQVTPVLRDVSAVGGVV